MRRRDFIFPALLLLNSLFSQSYFLRFYFPDSTQTDSADFHVYLNTNDNTRNSYLQCGEGKIYFQNIRRTGDSLFLEVRDFPMFFCLGMKIKNKIYEGFCYNSLKKNWKGKVLLVKQENFSPPPSDAPEFSSLPVQFYFTHPLPGTILTKYDKKNSRTYFSILSPSGDFGYAEGFFKNHSLKIFSFNGNGFFLIKGGKNQNTWRGVYISENGKKTFWESTDSVIKEKKSDKNFSLPQQTFLLPNGQTFSFLNDSLKGRPIVIHLLGTWCHNCRDESIALKEWVMKYYPKGIFFAALCVEKNNDTAYVRRRIEFVKERWNIHWPVIPAGISTAEPVASLFNLSENLAFPTTFFFDASHNPVSIHRTFSGPATGIHFTNWQKELESTLESLLKK